MPQHNISPVFDTHSKVLILGSFPSVKSREGRFFYDHPRNRFWQVLAALFHEEVPLTHKDKKVFLLSHNIALWDVIASCDIHASSDSSIRHAVANDLSVITQHCAIHAIICNGNASWRYYHHFHAEEGEIPVIKMPSTSPANAAFSLEKLLDAWKQILPFLSDA